MEIIDEETALEALDLVEQGQVVSYSDQLRYKGQVSDPDELMRLIGHGLRADAFPIVVEPVREMAVRASKTRRKIRIEGEESALEVLEIVERGGSVFYTDDLRVRTRIDDPAILLTCLKRAWSTGSQNIEVEVN